MLARHVLSSQVSSARNTEVNMEAALGFITIVVGAFIVWTIDPKEDGR